MILGDTLLTTFSTAKPLTGESMSSSAAPVLTVYRNGVLFVPVAAPVAAAIAAGQYTLTHGLTAANGYAANDFIAITARVTLDGVTITFPVWQGNLIYTGADLTLVLGSTIYPMCSTHRPGDGANADQDPGLPLGGGLLATLYRNLVAVVPPAATVTVGVGVHVITAALTVLGGWALGQKLDIQVRTTIDTITKTSWVFRGGTLVAAGPGPGPAVLGTVHHEVAGHPLRSA